MSLAQLILSFARFALADSAATDQRSSFLCCCFRWQRCGRASNFPAALGGVGLFALITCWLLWLVPRQVKNMGYALTDTELIYKRGAMWRTVTVVPYGRMQYVDLSQGPLMRMFGISDLRLHTASASTISNIQGLPTGEAEALREHLSRLGSSQMAGL